MANHEGVDMLVLETAAAKKSGMSYGKWKAMGGKVDPLVDMPVPNDWPTCRRCGKPFKPKKGVRQFYCNPECQYEAQKEKDRERKREYARAYKARKKAMAAE